MGVPIGITIIGAGPYGLSIAAHLRERGVAFRILGKPMQTWRRNMPSGMLLKSAGFASTLYDPGRTFTLQRFCKERNIAYEDLGWPVPLETFAAYGIAFQKRLVPDLEDEKLVAMKRCTEGFELQLESGQSFKTRKVILAVGIDYFRHVPAPLTHLPAQQVSHSADHEDLRKFRGQAVAVVGGGSSAIDTAVLLHEAKVNVRLITRKSNVGFGQVPATSRSTWRRICEPISGLGPGWDNRLCTDVPWLYRFLPDRIRLDTATTFLGPSGGWFMRERAASVPHILGHELQEAKVHDGRVHLRLVAVDNQTRTVTVDHVIAATGYKIDVRRLTFLTPDIVENIQLLGNTPSLSSAFESSVPGLFFVGGMSATSFGPVMRFAVGAEFTSRKISAHLARAN
jgi:FAD-dependent urate hydroxylase